MNNVFKVKFATRKKLTGLLGLSLESGKLEGVLLRRTNDSLQLQQTFSVTLSLDPMSAAPELAGREIRNQLDAAGVRERYCVVGVPSKWVLAAHAELPQLTDEDAEGFLQLEAERGFPSDPATLQIATSRCALKDGKQYVLLAGIANTQLAILEQVLVAANLKPVSFTLGVAALQPSLLAAANAEGSGVLAMAIGESQVSLQVTCGGGVAALRTLEGAIQIDPERRMLQPELIAREARITLGQLPVGLRETVKCIRIFGPPGLARQLADEMELRLGRIGLEVEAVTAYPPHDFGVTIPSDVPISTEFSMAARLLTGQSPVLEFLPPKPTAWQKLSKKYPSGKLRSAGAMAAGLMLLVGALFTYQQIQLARLYSQWSGMSTKVGELENMQTQIRQYRPWFEDSFRSLSILKQVTAAFPEDGGVTARTVEIRDGHAVICSGNAQDNAALLGMLAKLRGNDNVEDLKVDQIRGKAPMQFTFDFHWNNGVGHED